MKILFEVVIEGNVVLPISAEVESFNELPKLAHKITDCVTGIKKILPDVASRPIESVSASLEASANATKRRGKRAAAAAA